MKRLLDGLSGISKVLVSVGAVSLLVMTLLNVWDVIGRAAGKSTSLATEISILLMVYIVFLGAPQVLREDGHVRMDLARERLSGKGLMLTQAMTLVIVTIVGLVLVVEGAKSFIDAVETGQRSHGILRMPLSWFRAALPLGGLGLLTAVVLALAGRGPLRLRVKVEPIGEADPEPTRPWN